MTPANLLGGVVSERTCYYHKAQIYYKNGVYNIGFGFWVYVVLHLRWDCGIARVVEGSILLKSYLKVFRPWTTNQLIQLLVNYLPFVSIVACDLTCQKM